AQRGADGRRGSRLARGDVQFHVADDFLGHDEPSAVTARYSFSTFRKSSSTGVDRPKMVTITFSVARSWLTSSTIPEKLENGPSTIRTESPLWKWNFGFGFSAATETWLMMRSTSSCVSGVGLSPEPTNPVTFGVFFTTCHVASFISMLISTYPG